MTGPLAGIRIVDLSNVISGPMATQYLADQGADVIKVETPHGDMTRSLGPRTPDKMSAMYLTANRNKRAIALDLKSEGGKAVLAALLAQADVLVENFRPGALTRLGFGYEDVKADHPQLIYCSIAGFGQDGPYAGMRVYDPIIQAASGIAAAQRDLASQNPTLIQGLICDKLTALTAAQAMTAALLAREKTGAGQKLEIAMLDAAISFLWPDGMYNYTLPEGAAEPAPEFGTFYRLWPAADGFMAIAAVQQEEMRAMCAALGIPELLEDPRFATPAGRMQNAAALMGSMGKALAQRQARELMAAFAQEDAPGAKVNERADLFVDPQVQHNETIVRYDVPGIGTVNGPRHPTRFSATPAGAPRPAPRLGADSTVILSELGYDSERIEALIAGGTVVQADRPGENNG